MTRTPDAYQAATGRLLDAPIDRSQETYKPSSQQSRMVPPSGLVSRNGRRSAPQPSLTAKVLAWGGMGIAAAAATAGAVLAVRAVVDGIAGSDEDDAVEAARQRAKIRRNMPKGMPRNAYAGGSRRASLPPRFAGGEAEVGRKGPHHDEDARRQERARIEARRRTSQSHGRTHKQAGMFEDLNSSIQGVTSGLRDTLATVTSAIEGFRSVAGQAGSIMGEFREAADSVRTMFDPEQGQPNAASRASGSSRAGAWRSQAPRSQADRPDTMVDMRDAPDTAGERLRNL